MLDKCDLWDPLKPLISNLILIMVKIVVLIEKLVVFTKTVN